MKKALLLCDRVSSYDPDPFKKTDIFADVLDGMFDITVSDQCAGIGLKELMGYHMVIILSENWDRNADRCSVAALISYTVSGGCLWIAGDAVKMTAYHEMNMMMGAKYYGENPPCLQDYIVDKTHPVTMYSEDFSVLEIPYYMEMDPFADTHMLMEFRYAQKRYPAMWCRKYGWGKVVCMAMGAVPTTYLPQVRKIMWRTGEWILDRI